MKKLLCLIALTIAIVCTLVSCGDNEFTVSVNTDGYVVVNDIVTDIIADKEDVITVDEKGYLVVNGVKTEYEVKNKNHTFGDWKLYNEDETDCEKKLHYRVCSDCSSLEWKEGKYEDHDFVTVTTLATCQSGGYDTKTCKKCGKIEICNETPFSAHDYKEGYTTDNSFHWYECKNCDAISEKAEHTLGDDGFCIKCLAQIGDTVGIVYDISDDGTYAEVVGYNGTARSIKIADTYMGLPVKKIYSKAFYQNKSITSVIIPNSVTSIGSQAFYHCDYLTKVVLGEGVTSIGYEAFYYCENLTDLIMGNKVTSIAPYAFYHCWRLTGITLPDSVTYIGECAFWGCSRITSIIIPEGVASISDKAFYGCSSISEIVIPDSITVIYSYAFYNCKAITKATIPAYAISEIPTNSLKTLVITSGVSIREGALQGCETLTSVVIASSVTTIYRSAFANCTNLTDVYYTGTEEQWTAMSIDANNSYLTNATIHYNYVPEE